MNTKLIFFGSLEESVKGILRGSIALITFIILSYLWYRIIAKLFYSKYYNEDISNTKKIVGYSLAVFVLISAIGVQLPSSIKEATVYGSLVGFVLYGFLNGSNLITNKKWDYKITVIDILWGVISSSILSIIVYLVFK